LTVAFAGGETLNVDMSILELMSFGVIPVGAHGYM